MQRDRHSHSTHQIHCGTSLHANHHQSLNFKTTKIQFYSEEHLHVVLGYARNIRNKSKLYYNLRSYSKNQENIAHICHWTHLHTCIPENNRKGKKPQKILEQSITRRERNTVIMLPMVAVLETLDTYCTAFQHPDRRMWSLSQGKHKPIT